MRPGIVSALKGIRAASMVALLLAVAGCCGYMQVRHERVRFDDQSTASHPTAGGATVFVVTASGPDGADSFSDWIAGLIGLTVFRNGGFVQIAFPSDDVPQRCAVPRDCAIRYMWHANRFLMFLLQATTGGPDDYEALPWRAARAGQVTVAKFDAHGCVRATFEAETPDGPLSGEVCAQPKAE
jgi:hypothetical protein